MTLDELKQSLTHLSSDDREAMMRQVLLVRPETKEDLSNWIELFLGLKFPDTIVDPDSNCTPMEMIWKVYSKAKDGNDPEFSRVLFYAARDAGKTLAASVIVVLMICLLDRNCAHMAAIKDQSEKALQYIEAFLKKPVIKDLVTAECAKSKSRLEVIDGNNEKKYVRVITASVTGANSEHVPYMCVDGKTRILVKNYRETKSNRQRLSVTARGIFYSLQRKEEVFAYGFDYLKEEFGFFKVLRACKQKKDIYEVKMESGNVLRCTLEHPLFVLGKGFLPISEIDSNDRIVKIYKNKSGILGSSGKKDTVNQSLLSYKENILSKLPSDCFNAVDQVLLGSMLGDGGIYRKIKNNAYYSENHGITQQGYLLWKKTILETKHNIRMTKPTSGYGDGQMIGIASGNSKELNRYIAFKKTFEGLERLGPLGLAVWYMDDGCAGATFALSTECFTYEQNLKLSSFLNERFGFQTFVSKYSKKKPDGIKTYFCIKGTALDILRLKILCGDLFHEELKYKLRNTERTNKACLLCGTLFITKDQGPTSLTCGSVFCKNISTVNEKRMNKTFLIDTIKSVMFVGRKDVFDFTVDGPCNYFANSYLTHNSVDELDILRFPQAYEESKFIPAPYKGNLPITLLTSSRKYSFGYVQKEIDNAPETGLKIFHWNILDVTEKCPPSRHLPDEPKIEIYHNPETLKAIALPQYSLLQEDQQKKYIKSEGYAGCLKRCQIYAACKGLLANRATDTSSLLKPIDHVQSVLKSVSPDTARAQYLCQKPSTVGLVYGTLDERIHRLNYRQAMAMISNQEIPDSVKVTKADFVEFIKKKIINAELKPYGGVDFGHTHNFVFELAVVDAQKRCWFIETFSASEMLLEDAMPIVSKIILNYCPSTSTPFLFCDSAQPGHIASMKRNGFKAKGVKKYPGSVSAGIEIVRSKLQNGVGEASLFFVFEDDLMMKLLWKHMMMYHFALNAAGDPTDVPDEENDDENDAFRYLVMSVFGKGGQVVTAGLSSADMAYFAQKLAPLNPANQSGPFKNYLQEIMEKVNDDQEAILERKGSGGSISWNMESDLPAPPPEEKIEGFAVRDIIEHVIKSKEDDESNL